MRDKSETVYEILKRMEPKPPVKNPPLPKAMYVHKGNDLTFMTGLKFMAAAAAIAFGLSHAVMAQANGEENECGNHGNNCNNGGDTIIDLHQRINNSVRLRNSNKQGQLQGQKQHQGQGQGQSQEANNAGNTQSLVVNEAEQKRQAPGFGVASVYPTANCRTGLSGSLSIPGGGIGFGSAPLDENCARLEAARFAAQVLNNQEDAKALFCMSDFGKDAPSCVRQAAMSAKLNLLKGRKVGQAQEDSPFPK